jgi:hypothetical protein
MDKEKIFLFRHSLWHAILEKRFREREREKLRLKHQHHGDDNDEVFCDDDHRFWWLSRSFSIGFFFE